MSSHKENLEVPLQDNADMSGEKIRIHVKQVLRKLAARRADAQVTGQKDSQPRRTGRG